MRPRNHIGGSYEWNVLCPVCGLQVPSTDIKERWDGKFVCSKDWEPRHVLDFYKNRNDAHLLPYIYSDNNGVSVAPAVKGSTLSVTGEISRGTWGTATGVDLTVANNFKTGYIIYNGTVSKITKNGVDQRITDGTFLLDHGDTLNITYTVAPSFIQYKAA